MEYSMPGHGIPNDVEKGIILKIIAVPQLETAQILRWPRASVIQVFFSFFSDTLHAKWNIYPTSPTSYLNPEDSNLINRPLTDYNDVLGHHDEGIIFANTMAIHMNPILRKVLDKCESWVFEHWLIAIHKSLGKNVLDVDDSEHLHVHIMMMNEVIS